MLKRNKVKEMDDVSKVKSRTGKNFNKSFLTYGVAILVIIACLVMLSNQVASASKSIDVVVFKNDMLGKTLITEKDISKYSMSETEVKKGMVRYENKDELIGKYTNYYVRKGTPIYEDQVTKEARIRNQFLYVMSNNEELVTLPYRSLEAAGSILMPGDRIRIRATFSPQGMYGSTVEKESIILFENVVVKDLLNNNGYSVFEKYRDIMKLSEQEKEEAIGSDQFLRDTKPVSLVFTAEKERVSNFAKFNNTNEIDYTITVLARNKDTDILDVPLLDTIR